MFTHVSKMSLSKMSYYFKPVTYLRNHYIFREGEEADSVFVVVEGDYILTKSLEGKRAKAELYRPPCML